jgi:hypothetical protein
MNATTATRNRHTPSTDPPTGKRPLGTRKIDVITEADARALLRMLTRTSERRIQLGADWLSEWLRDDGWTRGQMQAAVRTLADAGVVLVYTEDDPYKGIVRVVELEESHAGVLAS